MHIELHFFSHFRNRRSLSKVFLGFSEAKPKQSNQREQERFVPSKAYSRHKRQDSLSDLSFTTTEEIGKLKQNMMCISLQSQWIFVIRRSLSPYI